MTDGAVQLLYGITLLPRMFASDRYCMYLYATLFSCVLAYVCCNSGNAGWRKRSYEILQLGINSTLSCIARFFNVGRYICGLRH